MKVHTFPFRSNFKASLKLFTAALLIAASAVAIHAQTTQSPPQLTLADILIGLRSKKLTLPEKNRLLTEAVIQRGITFGYTSEIEAELQATGADQSLIDAIKKKSPVVKTSAVVQPVETKPAAPPEWAVYQQRADASVARGDYEAAVVEYGKAIELRPTLSDAFLSRGLIYLNKNWLDMAIADFSKAAELNPKDAAAFANRGQAWEKKGDVQKAKADYLKALELKAEYPLAKTNLARIEAEEAKAQPKKSPADLSTAKSAADNTSAPVDAASASVVAPSSIDVGPLGPANAVRMVKPIYSQMAVRSFISGKVVVKVTLDEEGNVTSAKAVEGHQMLRQPSEEAAMKSKFKPATFQGKPIKSSGTITYNFDPIGGR